MDFTRMFYFVKYGDAVSRVIGGTFDSDGSPAFLLLREDGSHTAVRAVLTTRVPTPNSTSEGMYW